MVQAGRESRRRLHGITTWTDDRVEVSEHGPLDAPPLLLLHGLLIDRTMWHPVVETLGHSFRLLIPDLPGHGTARNRQWVSMSRVVHDLTDLIDSKVPDARVGVVGLSLGGYLALELARAAPDRIAGVVASGVNAVPLPFWSPPRLLGPVLTPFIVTRPMLRANARVLRIPPDLRPWYLSAARRTHPRAFARINRELTGYRPPVDNAFVRPVLVLCGGDEPAGIRRSAPSLAAAFARGEHRTVPGVGHGWIIERPALFTQTVSDFVTPLFP